MAQAGGASEHRVVRVDLSALGGSVLVGEGAVPEGRAPGDIGREVPPTYVPARNTVFLSVALGWAEVLGARDLYCGVTAVDYSGYPDCRPRVPARLRGPGRGRDRRRKPSAASRSACARR